MDIKGIISKMTLEQKASLVSGHDMWTTEAFEELGIPAIFVSDGPHGLRKQELDNMDAENNEIYDSIDAVCFPTACATAASLVDMIPLTCPLIVDPLLLVIKATLFFLNGLQIHLIFLLNQ